MRPSFTVAAFAAFISLGLGGTVFGLAAVNTQDDWRDRVLRELDLSDFEIVRINLPDPKFRGNGFLIEFETEEGLYSFVTRPHSVRSGHFEVLEDVGQGELRAVPLPPETTYRGEDGSGAIMAASIHLDRLTAWIALSDESVMGIQPLDSIVVGADPEEYIVYEGDDVVPGDWQCGVPDDANHDADQGIGSSGLLTCAHEITEVAFDADFEFFNRLGNSVPNVVANIESLMNALNVIYERDVLIREVIRTIIVRTSEPDPYTTTDPGSLLNQFRSHWNANHNNIARDHAHLMTGKNLNGGVIGIAFLGVICNVSASGYGLSESLFTGNFTFRVALTAHEMGHNWNAQHCDSQGSNCRIMCSGLGGCSGNITSFGSFEIGQISSFRNTRACIYSPCANLVDFAHDWGSLVSGGLQELRFSDNTRLVSRSRFGFQAAEPNLVILRVGAIAGATSTTADTIDLRFEGRLNTAGGTTRLKLRNWTTNQLQTVATFPIGTTEIVEVVNDLPAANRVRASDRRIELAVHQFVVVTFSVLGFNSPIDHIEILVEE